MEKDKHNLEEPAASCGKKVKIGDIIPEPMENMEETLTAMGYISFEELVEHLSSQARTFTQTKKSLSPSTWTVS